MTTGFGYHIIKLNDTRPADIAPFDDVKQSIREHLFMEKAKTIISRYINMLKKKADIELYYAG